MPVLRVIQLSGILAAFAACGRYADGCGGVTCPFAPPTHHAAVNGVVFDLNDRPLAGIHTSVVFGGQSYSGVGPQTDRMGRFSITVRADIPVGGPDTVTAWVRAAQANPPPAAVIKDSVAVLLRFKSRTEPPQIVETSIRLPVAS